MDGGQGSIAYQELRDQARGHKPIRSATLTQADATLRITPGLYWWVRKSDETGMSGIGRVAQVAIFEDGSAVLRWIKGRNNAGVGSLCVYNSVADLIHIHGHGNHNTGYMEPLCKAPDPDVHQAMMGAATTESLGATILGGAQFNENRGTREEIAEVARVAISEFWSGMDKRGAFGKRWDVSLLNDIFTRSVQATVDHFAEKWGL